MMILKVTRKQRVKVWIFLKETSTLVFAKSAIFHSIEGGSHG